MKLDKYIRTFLLLSVIPGFMSCHKADEVKLGDKSAVLDMTAQLFNSASDKVWQGILSANQDSIYFDIPYYLSDTVAIKPDLTKMILRANLPSGAVVTPELGGLKDLSKPYPVTVQAGNGTQHAYVILARLLKSDKKEMTGFSIPSLELKGINASTDTIKLIVPPKFDQNLLKHVVPSFTLSPWASVSPGMGEPQDFTKNVVYTVTALDGSTSTITVVQSYPKVLEYGFGLTYLMWQKDSDAAGFTRGLDCGLAVCGDKLIVARRNLAFSIYNKLTGQLLSEHVNIQGTDADGVGGIIFGIDTDDRDNLLAVNFTRIANAGNILKIFRWKDGLSNPPEVILQLPVTHFASETNRGIDLGRSIKIAGDIDGNAQIMVSMGGNGTDENRSLKFSVKNGVITNAANPEIVAGEGVKYKWRGKSIPVAASDNTPYFVLSVGTDKGLVYMDENRKAFLFETNENSSAFYNNTVYSIAYGEFNHAKYMFAASGNWAYQTKLLGFDVTNPSLIPIDKNDDAYYKKFNVFTSLPNILQFAKGDNENATGDIAVKMSDDGNSIYVYMLVTDAGIMAYELTKYENVN